MKKKGSQNSILFFSIVLVSLIIDLLTKFYIISNFRIDESYTIIKNFLSITYKTNFGAAFSILQGQKWFFIVFSIIVLGVMIYYYKKIRDNRFLGISCSLITAGTIGNLIDRLAYGYIIDFIDFSFWPTFNVADICLSIGIALLACYFFKNRNL